MKKNLFFILSLILLPIHNALATSHVADSISYLKIGELLYKDGQLYQLLYVRPSNTDGNEEEAKEYKVELSTQQTKQFLQLVEELNLLDIGSNERKNQHEFPFKVLFVKNNEFGAISAYRNGMSEEEKASFDNYLHQIYQTIHYWQGAKTLLASFPDGKYEVKRRRKYELYIGPKAWVPWEKSGNTITGINTPLIIMDGAVVDVDILSTIKPEMIHSFKILKDKKDIAFYGEQAKHGVILVETKRK